MKNRTAVSAVFKGHPDPIPVKYSGEKRFADGLITLYIYKTPGGTYSYDLGIEDPSIYNAPYLVPFGWPDYRVADGRSLDYDFTPLSIQGEATHTGDDIHVPTKTTWQLTRHLRN